MDSLKETILLIIGIIASLGIFAGGLGFLLSRFSKGKKEERQDIVQSSEQLTQFWKDQADGFKEMLETKTTELNAKINDLSREVGELRGQLNAEKKANEKLEMIFQNRDPQTQEFMKLLTASAVKADEFRLNYEQDEKKKLSMWAEIASTLKEIHKLTLENNQILDARKMPVTIVGEMQSDTPKI